MKEAKIHIQKIKFKKTKKYFHQRIIGCGKHGDDQNLIRTYRAIYRQEQKHRQAVSTGLYRIEAGYRAGIKGRVDGTSDLEHAA